MRLGPSRVRVSLRLARWLGPWAKDAVPRGVTRTTSTLDDARGYRAFVYRSRARAHGAYLVVPGLHYAGPDDPRLDRFCRVLAASGFVVLAPALPDHLALRVAPTATDDLAIAWNAVEAMARAEAMPRPALFSISFGSLPAIALAARDGYRDRIGALVVFGGYADFDASVRFAVTGEARDGARAIAAPFDPLNAPVVFLALLPHLPAVDREAVARAWRTMVERTWGRTELKAPDARRSIADDLARSLAPADRDLFLVGCGLREDRALLDAGLAAVGDAFAFADPRPYLARVAAPIVVLHGRDDDVIPWLEAEKLRRALPPGHPHRVLVTGMYDHTGATRPSPRALARELVTMFHVVRAMADAPQLRSTEP